MRRWPTKVKAKDVNSHAISAPSQARPVLPDTVSRAIWNVHWLDAVSGTPVVRPGWVGRLMAGYFRP
jgi:hypothetical protein